MHRDNSPSSEWVPIAEAARQLQTTPLNVLMHIKRGFLLGEERDGEWLVEAASLTALMRQRGQGNVPAVCQSGCARHAGGCGTCS
ncbi:MAG: hypothetical protein ACYC9I_03835 [Desulfuromonadales bacterium]